MNLSFFKDFLHLLFPHNCEGCGTDILNEDSYLCAKCLTQLPDTGFISHAGNPIENRLIGRMKVAQAAAGYYFTKDGLLQLLINQLKYKNNKEMGYYLGKLLAYQLEETDRFNGVDVFIPLPLNKRREEKRGYNQAQMICEGIVSVWSRPIVNNAIIRNIETETQTNKSLGNRWDNVAYAFKVIDPSLIINKHICLVDDVITTGASMEACGSKLLEVEGVTLSLLTVGYTV